MSILLRKIFENLGDSPGHGPKTWARGGPAPAALFACTGCCHASLSPFKGELHLQSASACRHVACQGKLIHVILRPLRSLRMTLHPLAQREEGQADTPTMGKHHTRQDTKAKETAPPCRFCLLKSGASCKLATWLGRSGVPQINKIKRIRNRNRRTSSWSLSSLRQPLPFWGRLS